jgi:hypothetical protein
MNHTPEQIKNLLDHSIMLGQIATYVEEFAQESEDTTLMCVLNLLYKYHACKSDQAFMKLQELRQHDRQ